MKSVTLKVTIYGAPPSVQKFNLYFRDAVTEVWELADENNKVISPSLPYNRYYYGIALFPVNSDFCKK